MDNLYDCSLSDAWDAVVDYDGYYVEWHSSRYTHVFPLKEPYNCELSITPKTEEEYHKIVEFYTRKGDGKVKTFQAGEGEYFVYSIDSWRSIRAHSNGAYFEIDPDGDCEMPSDEMLAGISMIPFEE